MSNSLISPPSIASSHTNNSHQTLRKAVCMVLVNSKRHVFLGRRLGTCHWQFPQGGIDEGEKEIEAMYRESFEEIGLDESDIEVLGVSEELMIYHLPRHFVRNDERAVCTGQAQRWFLIALKRHESCIRLNRTFTPEFDSWRWVPYHYPIQHVIHFKKQMYQQGLCALEKFLPT